MNRDLIGKHVAMHCDIGTGLDVTYSFDGEVGTIFATDEECIYVEYSYTLDGFERQVIITFHRSEFDDGTLVFCEGK